MKLKPFDKVLVRDNDGESWEISIFGRYVEGDPVFPYICINEHYKQCIPYEGNESLLGTTTSPKPEYEFKDGDPVIVWNSFDSNTKYIAVFKRKTEKYYITYSQTDTIYTWDNCIPFKSENKE